MNIFKIESNIPGIMGGELRIDENQVINARMQLCKLLARQGKNNPGFFPRKTLPKKTRTKLSEGGYKH